MGNSQHGQSQPWFFIWIDHAENSRLIIEQVINAHQYLLMTIYKHDRELWLF